MSSRVVNPPHAGNARRSFLQMRGGDVALVSEMEQRNYEFPWSAGIFRDCIKAGYACQVMYFGDQLIGYGILQSACLLYTSPSPRDGLLSRMPSSA